jgi:hypothetical protein
MSIYTIRLGTYDGHRIECPLPYGATERDAMRCIGELRRRFYGYVHSVRVRIERAFDPRQVVIPARYSRPW